MNQNFGAENYFLYFFFKQRQKVLSLPRERSSSGVFLAVEIFSGLRNLN